MALYTGGEIPFVAEDIQGHRGHLGALLPPEGARGEVPGISEGYLEGFIDSQELCLRQINLTPYGDIDLFIVKETNARMVDRFVEVKRLIYDPESRIPVSPLVYTPEEVTERLRSGDDFVKEVMREGKVLYEKKD